MSDYPDNWFRDDPRQARQPWGKRPDRGTAAARRAARRHPAAGVQSARRLAVPAAAPVRARRPGARSAWRRLPARPGRPGRAPLRPAPAAAPPDPGHHRRPRGAAPGRPRDLLLLPQRPAHRRQRARRLLRPPGRHGRHNWLITGSDSRQGLTRKEERQLATGRDIGGRRSDTTMILHIPGNGGPAHAGQPAPRLVPADPGLRHQQAQRRVLVRRPEAAG